MRLCDTKEPNPPILCAPPPPPYVSYRFILLALCVFKMCVVHVMCWLQRCDRYYLVLNRQHKKTIEGFFWACLCLSPQRDLKASPTLCTSLPWYVVTGLTMRRFDLVIDPLRLIQCMARAVSVLIHWSSLDVATCDWRHDQLLAASNVLAGTCYFWVC